MNDLKKRIAVAALAISAVGVGGIAGWEGFRDKAYLPTKNDVPTIGYGTTQYTDGIKVRMGDSITKDEARRILEVQTNQFADGVRKLVKVPLYQEEFDAYVSLAYNIGLMNFANSTLLKKLNRKDYAGACAEIKKWKYQNGRVLKGLEKRRNAEYVMCMGGVTE